MTVYAELAHLRDQMKHQFPLEISLHDPVTGEPFSVTRADLIGMLLVDSSNLMLEGQMVAAQYMEASRLRRASQLSRFGAERVLRQWKAKTAMDYRETAEKKVTVAETEAHYRLLPEYTQLQQAIEYTTTLEGLFEDLQRAINMKSSIIRSQTQLVIGHERVFKAEDEADLEATAAAAIARTRSGETPEGT